jgi:hypothetical protein
VSTALTRVRIESKQSAKRLYARGTVATKDQYTLRLSGELWAQIDDLEGYFGDNRAEILTYILRNWFSTNQRQITEQKESIDRVHHR